jgi:hypothetical protein
MTNHHSGPNTAEEIYSIVPVLAGFSADEPQSKITRLTLRNTTFHVRIRSSAASASRITSRSSGR